MSRAPWLGGRRGDSVSFGSTLPRAARTHDGAWLDRAGDGERPAVGPSDDDARRVTAVPSCQTCADSAALHLDIEQARREAVAAGHREGLAETAALRARLEATVAAAQRARTTRDDALTELVVDVALGLCAELAPAASSIDRRALVQLVHRAITGTSAGGGGLVMRMCADDVAALSGQLPAGVSCEVGADLSPGELFCEAPRLVVDGRWPARLAALREPLLALVREPALELMTESRPVEAGGADGA